ncbi:MAG: DUF1501 domain-containing protein [Bdellovibrionales bacterium]|nr:DUF1501 domain-containing protein [Bdellovibrionales bacterium]
MKRSFNPNFSAPRREFLSSAIELAILCSQASILGSGRANAQGLSDGNLKFFVDLSIGGGLCPLGSYLSPTAKVDNLSDLSRPYKFPGYATSVHPSTEANASNERVLSGQSLYLVRTQVGAGNDIYRMPILWESMIPTSNGSPRPMKDLISNHCLLLYGLESNPAHPLAASLVLDPAPGGRTIGGYIANRNSLLIPAIVGTKGNRNFRSNQGTMTARGGDDQGALQDLLHPFLPGCRLEDSSSSLNSMNPSECGNAARRKWFQELREPMNRALIAMKNHQKQKLPSIELVYDLVSQARLIVDQNSYADSLQDFINTSQRYLALIGKLDGSATEDSGSSVLSSSLAGLTTPQAGNPTITHVGAMTGFSAQNPRVLLTGATLHQSLAYRFALIEVAIRRNFSSVFQMGLGDSLNLNYQGSGFMRVIQSDAHSIGAVPNLFGAAALYTAVNTLLLELKRALISDNLWGQTLIHLSTEFSRTHKPDGTGSDHNDQGSFSALFSGKIEGFKIYGQTKWATQSENYPGYSGEGGSVMVIDGHRLGFKDLGTSIANLFYAGTAIPEDLATLNGRQKSLLEIANGKIVANSNNLTPLGTPEG